MQPHKRQVRKKESAEKQLSTTKSETTPQAEKPERQVQNVAVATTARELLAPTCAITGDAVSEQAAAFGLSRQEYLLMLKSWGDLRGMPRDITDDLAA